MSKFQYMKIFICLIMLNFIYCGSTEEWKSRTIYQVLTDRFAREDGSTAPCQNLGNYCGGTYRGLINNLDYIQNMGFDAIWISPIVDNTDGGYHGYWARNWNKLNSNFGSDEDFFYFVSECHNRGIWVMVDIVMNHIGPVGTDYSSIYPFNSPDHYHNYCVIQDSDFNGGNQWNVEHCRLAGLPDLNQENPFVREQLLQWVENIKNTY